MPPYVCLWFIYNLQVGYCWSSPSCEVTGTPAYNGIWFWGRTRNPWNIEEYSYGLSAGPASCTSAGLLLLFSHLKVQESSSYQLKLYVHQVIFQSLDMYLLSEFCAGMVSFAIGSETADVPGCSLWSDCTASSFWDCGSNWCK